MRGKVPQKIEHKGNVTWLDQNTADLNLSELKQIIELYEVKFKELEKKLTTISSGNFGSDEMSRIKYDSTVSERKSAQKSSGTKKTKNSGKKKKHSQIAESRLDEKDEDLEDAEFEELLKENKRMWKESISAKLEEELKSKYFEYEKILGELSARKSALKREIGERMKQEKDMILIHEKAREMQLILDEKDLQLDQTDRQINGLKRLLEMSKWDEQVKDYSHRINSLTEDNRRLEEDNRDLLKPTLAVSARIDLPLQTELNQKEIHIQNLRERLNDLEEFYSSMDSELSWKQRLLKEQQALKQLSETLEEKERERKQRYLELENLNEANRRGFDEINGLEEEIASLQRERQIEALQPPDEARSTAVETTPNWARMQIEELELERDRLAEEVQALERSLAGLEQESNQLSFQNSTDFVDSQLHSNIDTGYPEGFPSSSKLHGQHKHGFPDSRYQPKETDLSDQKEQIHQHQNEEANTEYRTSEFNYFNQESEN